MSQALIVGVISDVHYASALEKARGDDYELRAVANPVLRSFLRWYRNAVWLKQPLQHNHLLDHALERLRAVDWLVANGDFSCDSAFVGVCDDAACQSVAECLGKIRERFPNRSRTIFGDHELGKFSLVGKRGGMRLASFQRATEQLGIEPFWEQTIGRYTLIGLCSSLLALPAIQSEQLESERRGWSDLRSAHLENIRNTWRRLPRDQRLVLFCHDPTGIPFLFAEAEVQRRIDQIEATIIGHLHSPLILWKSRLLAGMPEIRFLGHSVRKMSRALHEARIWRHFNVHLCPSLAGVELLKDGGFLTLRLAPEADRPLEIERHRLQR